MVVLNFYGKKEPICISNKLKIYISNLPSDEHNNWQHSLAEDLKHGNILVHRDYSSAYPAKVIIEKDWLKTENWCIPRRHGNIMQDEFQQYRRTLLFKDFLLI